MLMEFPMMQVAEWDNGRRVRLAAHATSRGVGQLRVRSADETPQPAHERLPLGTTVDTLSLNLRPLHRRHSVAATPPQFGSCSGGVRVGFGYLQWHATCTIRQ
jgi:hypothetical protein